MMWWRRQRRAPSTDTLRARRRLAEVTRDDRRVHEVADAMRELRSRNGLADLVTKALKGAR